jgi:hypothetical protein
MRSAERLPSLKIDKQSIRTLVSTRQIYELHRRPELRRLYRRCNLPIFFFFPSRSGQILSQTSPNSTSHGRAIIFQHFTVWIVSQGWLCQANISPESGNQSCRWSALVSCVTSNGSCRRIKGLFLVLGFI